LFFCFLFFRASFPGKPKWKVSAVSAALTTGALPKLPTPVASPSRERGPILRQPGIFMAATGTAKSSKTNKTGQTFMPDITMCDNRNCPVSRSCHRSPLSGTQPSQYRQAWSIFKGGSGCDGYWSIYAVDFTTGNSSEDAEYQGASPGNVSPPKSSGSGLGLGRNAWIKGRAA